MHVPSSPRRIPLFCVHSDFRRFRPSHAHFHIRDSRLVFRPVFRAVFRVVFRASYYRVPDFVTCFFHLTFGWPGCLEKKAIV
ncbi:hypothetical protein AAEP93_008736 [Penicillium crustosum]